MYLIALAKFSQRGAIFLTILRRVLVHIGFWISVRTPSFST
jgi:hypothetical protein